MVSKGFGETGPGFIAVERRVAVVVMEGGGAHALGAGRVILSWPWVPMNSSVAGSGARVEVWRRCAEKAGVSAEQISLEG
jgi:hypothetical protein